MFPIPNSVNSPQICILIDVESTTPVCSCVLQWRRGPFTGWQQQQIHSLVLFIIVK